MSNKQRLTTANTKFEERLIKMINELEEQKSPEGQYVWKKCEYSTTTKSYANPTITLNGAASNVKVTTTSGIDLSQVEADFFGGFTYNNGYVNLVYENGNLYYEDVNKTKYLIIWDKSTQTFVVNNFSSSFNSTWNYVGTKNVIAVEVGELIDFVVADDENAYPDGDYQDGYWYELVEEGVCGVDFGEVTLTSTASSITVQHNLKDTPKVCILFAKGQTNTSSTDFIFECDEIIMKAPSYVSGATYVYGYTGYAVKTTSATSSANEIATPTYAIPSTTNVVFNRRASNVSFASGTYKWIVAV